jgi:hypothetical protein
MEDIIDIIVTETTNLITITSSGSDEVIDVNIIDNREDIVLNVTPSVVEININSLVGNFGVNWGQIGGTLTNQTDLNTALGLKADLVGGKVPSSQLPSYVDDVVEVANYAALPATGETGKIYVTIDTNYIYRWTGSVYVEIKDSSAVWGAITGTLSNQTDLQNALNAKFDDPTGDTTQYIAGDGSLITFPVAGQAGTLVREVRNTTGATLTKGTIVYISGATGNKPTVSKAIATGDSTSAQTFGMLQANIANNANGYAVCSGDLSGLDTSALTEGQQLYLSGVTAGAYTTTKSVAPIHLVYIGVVTRSHPTQGQIEVKIQNGYELDEIHDVLITSKANNDGLFYESSTSLWKNKSIATVLGYTPANGANYLPLAGGTMTGAIVGTTATFTNAGTGIGLGVTNSGSGGDGIKITHTAGRAFNILSSANGFGIIINNETIATSVPLTIQKQGATVITLTDAGAGSFSSSLTASSFIKSGGTSAQFLKADGSVDSTAYLPLTGGTLTGALNGTSANFSSYLNAQTIDISNTSASNALRITHTNTSYHAVSITATGGSALYATGSVTVIGTLTATGVVTAQAGLANGTGQGFTFGSTSGVLAITSQLSSYLPLAGGTLTGALNGTSASFAGTVTNRGLVIDGANNGNVAKINWTRTDQSWSVNNETNLRFYTSSGNTLSPATQVLELASTGAATFSSSVTATGGVNAGDSKFFNTVQLTDSLGGTCQGFLWTDAANTLKIGTGTVAGGNVKMTITSGGNVGIGTTSPTNGKLEVQQSATTAALWVQTGGTSGSYTIADFRTGTNLSAFSIKGNGDLYAANNAAFFFGSSALTYLAGGNTGMSFAVNGRASSMTLNSDGTVCIGRSTAPSSSYTAAFQEAIAMYINSNGNNMINWFNASGTYVSSIVINSTSVNYNTSSDYRLKTDLKSFKGLDLVSKINVYDFAWKSDNSRTYGVIAHELQDILPDAVSGIKDALDENGNIKNQGVDYSKIVPVMVQAIKDLKQELDLLKNK